MRNVEMVLNKIFLKAEVLRGFRWPTVFDVGHCKYQLRPKFDINVPFQNCGPRHIYNRPSHSFGDTVLFLRGRCRGFEDNTLSLHPLIGLMTLQFRSVVPLKSFDEVVVFRTSPSQAVVCL